ncbi:MAG TPA: transglycosylase domain-containing protein [Silvibacterium sp.]|nr:transglycosylase domain-containing protein [Silvibacterium sp.]
MAVKIKFAPPKLSGPHTVRNLLLIGGGVVLLCFLTVVCIFGFYYVKYQHVVDQRLEKPLFEDTAKIYAAPQELRPGQKFTADSIAQDLRNAGYSLQGHGSAAAIGTFSEGAESIAIHPGPQSYHAPDGATISFEHGAISQITGDNGQQLAAYELEPVLITDLSDQNRAKRRLVSYDQIPPIVVQAVTSIEDRRYFQHGGVDYYAIFAWAFHDLRGDRRYAGGASTLTMQLAKEFFLTPERTFHRKFLQIVITFQLEHRFSKQKIFELYANEVPLGQRGSFSINGFGEAAQAYFGEDVRQLTLPQAALLAGLIQSPSRLNPYRHAQRALLRRNVVLDAMAETGDITRQQAEAAKLAPLNLVAGAVDAGEAPYFVDLVREQLASRLGENDYNTEGLRIYTSLDPDLQRAASEAIAEGMKTVDQLVEKRHARLLRRGHDTPLVYPQVALVALNPHTGQVLALVGGRNYGESQFDHAASHRPTASTFKPFVYAAAFNSALTGAVLTNPDGTSAVFSPVTMLNDQQTSFTMPDGTAYTPRDFENTYYGEVTARFALMKSLNNPTITLAEMVGLNNVASLARDAGITSARATPAMAIGAYDATPLEMAGAYTTFANGGVKIDPWMLASVRSGNGDVMDDYAPNSKPLLDPRVAFLATAMLEDVINHGTAEGVRSQYDFRPPAAGKTGTEHDSWFIGYTSNLLCAVWVGNDDYTDLKIEGAFAATPIWAAFMKRAVQLPQYSDTKDFVPPPGVSEVSLDKNTNLLADASCPDDYTAWFLDGTQPTDTCDHSFGDQRNVFQRLFGLGEKPSAPPPVNAPAIAPRQPPPQVSNGRPVQQQNTVVQPPPEKKKRGFWGKLFGKKDDKGKSDQDTQQPNPQ